MTSPIMSFIEHLTQTDILMLLLLAGFNTIT